MCKRLICGIVKNNPPNILAEKLSNTPSLKDLSETRLKAYSKIEGKNMITYDPFWRTLKARGISTYAMINKYGYSSHTLHRLRHNGGISTSLINELCTLLQCKVSDIITFTPDEKLE